MPLVLHLRRGQMRLVAFTAAITALSGVVGVSSANADGTTCSPPALTQPFLSWGDNNWYAAPAGAIGDSGWTLSGGAQQITVTLPDGTTAPGLDLPSGSQAVSPTMCVDSSYPTARTMVRNVVGAEGVFFYVSYANTATWNTPKNTGQVHGSHSDWTLSNPVNLQPSNASGWQLVRFTFVPGGQHSDFQLYNFYVDPHRSG